MKNFIKNIYYRVKFFSGVKFGRNLKLGMGNDFGGGNVIGNRCVISKSKIGYGSYLSEGCNLRSTMIGKYCSIGKNLQTFLGEHPSSRFVSTHPAFFSVKKQSGFTFVSKNRFDEHRYLDTKHGQYVVEIGNDVWIGNNVVIRDGVTIGDGAIVGTASVVTKDVEPYSIVAGVPAKVIKYRFDPDEIQTLLSMKWWDWEISQIQKQAESFDDIKKLKHLWSI